MTSTARNRDVKAALAAIYLASVIIGLRAADQLGWLDIWAAFKSSF